MESFFTPQNIMFALGLIGIIFVVYDRFTKPQIKADKTDSMMAMEIKNLTEKLQLLTNNDIHEIKGMLIQMRLDNTALQVQVAKLETKMDERIPKQ